MTMSRHEEQTRTKASGGQSRLKGYQKNAPATYQRKISLSSSIGNVEMMLWRSGLWLHAVRCSSAVKPEAEGIVGDEKRVVVPCRIGSDWPQRF